MPQRGPLTIDVPGAVDAWVQLLDRFGRRSLADALAPAARTADGRLRADRHHRRAPSTPSLPTFDDAAQRGLRQCRRTGRHVPPAARWRRRLRAIADGGREAYYGGPIGEEIARAIQAAGGVMTADDIAAHRGDWVEPISTTYAGVEVATIPPNSQGITALMALERPLRRSTGRWTRRPSAFTRRSRRSRWPGASATDASPTPIAGLADPSVLLSPEHARWLASRLSPDEAHRYTPTNPPGGGTVYLCAADADGMMVSLIESNYMGFGSGIMGGSTGIMLQNRGAYFCAGSVASQRAGAAVADAAHAHAGHAAARWPRGGRARRDGRRRPAADDGPARDRPARRRARRRRRLSTGRAGWSRPRRRRCRSAR